MLAKMFYQNKARRVIKVSFYLDVFLTKTYHIFRLLNLTGLVFLASHQNISKNKNMEPRHIWDVEADSLFLTCRSDGKMMARCG